MAPKYPIYIVSKDRSDCCFTADCLIQDNVDFKIVIEPVDKDLYLKKYSINQLLIVPFSNLNKGSLPARNWIWEYNIKKFGKNNRHWCLDDNIRKFRRYHKGLRIQINSGIGLRIIEDFIDRYENVGIAGPNYTTFAIPHKAKLRPFLKNCHVYSCMLILNSLPFRWRGRWNEDVDLCLQTLAMKFCTIQTYAILIDKVATMSMKGGNSLAYQERDSRLYGTHILIRRWPKIVELTKKWGRPHFKIKNNWLCFKNIPLIKKKGIKIKQKSNEYGLKLQQKQPIKSKRLQQFFKNNI